MKIVYLTDVFPPRCGGSGWSVYFAAKSLRQAGHEVQIIALAGEERSYDGFNITTPGFRSLPLPLFRNWKRERIDLPRIIKSISAATSNADVIHAHHKFSAGVAAGLGQKFFATVRDYWPVCICGRGDFKTGAVCDARDFEACSRNEARWKGTLAPLAYPLLSAGREARLDSLKRAEKIFCISRYVREQLRPVIEEGQLVLMPNWAEDIRPRETGAPEFDGRYMLYIGRLEQNKGVQLLPEIVQRSGANIPLVVVGDGSLRPGLEADFIKAGTEAKFAGYRDYPEMLSILRRAEFVLFPSVWPEPLGRVLIEAAMMGKPAVAFAHEGGHNDVLSHDLTGYLSDSSETFARYVAHLAADESTRNRLGNAAREKFSTEFHPDVLLPRLLQHYEDSL